MTAGSHDGASLPPQRSPSIRQQVESCFGNEGLRQDRYLHDLIAESPGGWVDLDAVLSLKRIRALRAKREDVLRALRDSWLETWRDPDGSSAAVRRPPGHGPLPELAPGPEPRVQTKEEASGGRGAATAREPRGPPADTRAAPCTLFPGRLNGAVVAYDEESGSASIACSQTEALFQRHVSVDWREIEQAGAALNLGSLVSFRVELGASGEPRGRELRLRAPEEAGEEPEELEARPSKRPRRAPGAVAGAVVGRRYQGAVKSFHEGVGVGFIACKATHATFGRDVAVDRTECAGFSPGDMVSFTLATDPDLGTPKATDLEAAAGAPDEGSAAEPAKLPAKLPAKPTVATRAPVGRAGDLGSRYVGVVKCFFQGRPGSGRITCEDLGRDVVTMEGELAGFAVGDPISFLLSAEPGSGIRKATEVEAE